MTVFLRQFDDQGTLRHVDGSNSMRVSGESTAQIVAARTVLP
jgi:hypothetical protein